MVPLAKFDGFSLTIAWACLAPGRCRPSARNALTVGAVTGPVPGTDSSSASSPRRPLPAGLSHGGGPRDRALSGGEMVEELGGLPRQGVEIEMVNPDLAPQLGCRADPLGSFADIGDAAGVRSDHVADRGCAGPGSTRAGAASALIDRNTAEPPDVSGWFEAPAVRCYPWMATYDRAAYLGMLASQSSYALMEPD